MNGEFLKSLPCPRYPYLCCTATIDSWEAKYESGANKAFISTINKYIANSHHKVFRLLLHNPFLFYNYT